MTLRRVGNCCGVEASFDVSCKRVGIERIDTSSGWHQGPVIRIADGAKESAQCLGGHGAVSKTSAGSTRGEKALSPVIASAGKWNESSGWS